LMLTLNQIDDATYVSLGFIKRSQTIALLNPLPNKIQSYLNYGWVIAGLIVLLTNARKRTTHDFIAGTVVVKSIYLETMRKVVNATETSDSSVEKYVYQANKIIKKKKPYNLVKLVIRFYFFVSV